MSEVRPHPDWLPLILRTDPAATGRQFPNVSRIRFDVSVTTPTVSTRTYLTALFPRRAAIATIDAPVTSALSTSIAGTIHG